MVHALACILRRGDRTAGLTDAHATETAPGALTCPAVRPAVVGAAARARGVGQMALGDDDGGRAEPRADLVGNVARAWLDSGPRPDVHTAAQARLLAEWPTLGEAVAALASAWAVAG